jgi:predicted DNA-binding helix-hairpin-helix protein
MIIMARKLNRLNSAHLQKIGVVMKRARYFITCLELQSPKVQDMKPEIIRQILLEKQTIGSDAAVQLKLFQPTSLQLKI